MRKTWLKVIAELIIAALLFFLLLKYVPPLISTGWNAVWQDSSVTDYSAHSNTTPSSLVSPWPNSVRPQWFQTNNGWVPDYNDNNNESLSEENPWQPTSPKQTTTDILLENQNWPTTTKQSCSLPWGWKLSHNQQVRAYKEDVANDENICEWEIRVCNDWQLQWWYEFESCSFTIDWYNDKQEIIEWATQTRHNIFTYIKRSDDPQEFRQPARQPASIEWVIFDTNGKRVDKLTDKNYTQRDSSQTTFLEYSLDWLVPEDTTQTGSSCRSPRSTRVPHGTFVTARESSYALPDQQCKLQHRPCIDWDLLGSYKEKSCQQAVANTNESQTELSVPDPWVISDIPRWNSIKDDSFLITKQPRQQALEQQCTYQSVQILNIQPTSSCSTQNCLITNPRFEVLIGNSSYFAWEITFFYQDNATWQTWVINEDLIWTQRQYIFSIPGITKKVSDIDNDMYVAITVIYTTACGQKSASRTYWTILPIWASLTPVIQTAPQNQANTSSNTTSSIQDYIKQFNTPSQPIGSWTIVCSNQKDPVCWFSKGSLATYTNLCQAKKSWATYVYAWICDLSPGSCAWDMERWYEHPLITDRSCCAWLAKQSVWPNTFICYKPERELCYPQTQTWQQSDYAFPIDCRFVWCDAQSWVICGIRWTVQKNYENMCLLERDKWMFLYSGQCIIDE